MNDVPSTKYKGHQIIYREDYNDWKCNLLDMEGPTLGAVKRKIDNMDRAERQIGVRAVLIESRSYLHTLKMVTLGTLCDNNRENERYHEAWVTDDKKQRSKECLHNLYPLSELPKLEAWIEQTKVVAMHEKKAEQLHELAQPFTDAGLRALKAG